jgi:hypothetical protein
MPSVTQARSMLVTENLVILIDRKEKFDIKIDRTARPMYMAEFSVTHIVWACVTLGFCNSVSFNYFKMRNHIQIKKKLNPHLAILSEETILGWHIRQTLLVEQIMRVLSKQEKQGPSYIVPVVYFSE